MALYAVRDLITRRRLAGRPIPHEVLSLYAALDSASLFGRESDTAPAQLGDDFIGASEAAEIIGCSSRWVREIHADLDGRLVAGRWVFPRHVVVEYAQS